MRTMNKENLFLAELKYFDKDHNGIEVTEDLSYVIIERFGNEKEGYTFLNVFDRLETFPVFKRNTCYENYSNGICYGSKIESVSSFFETGPCWLIKSSLKDTSLPENVSMEDLENIVLISKNYFKDRKSIAARRMKKFDNYFKMLRIIKNDRKHEDYMNYYFEERAKEKVKVK